MESIVSFLWYFLKANVVLAVLAGFYLLALRKTGFYTFNRVYVMLAFAAMLLLPLVELPLDMGRAISSDNAPANVVMLPIAALYAPVIEATSTAWWLQWQYGVALLLGVGIIIYAVRLLVQLGSLYFFAQKTLVRHTGQSKYNVSNRQIGPFSFFSFICVNPSLYTEQELAEVLAHERVHVRQLHSVDILLLEIFRCIFWVNPFIHLLRREARQNLEYLADRQVVRMGFSSIHYQYTLLKVADSKILPVIVSEFRMSNLKKRIVMMNKSKASRLSLLRYVLVVPMLGLLWFYTAPAKAQELGKKEKKEAQALTTKGKIADIKLSNVSLVDDNGEVVFAKDKPLIIMDGKEVANDISLNPRNIKSMSVLKNDAAIEQYGARGENGVILITSKKDGDDEVKGGDVIIYHHGTNKEEEKDDRATKVIVRSSSKEDSTSTLLADVLFLVDGKEAASSEVRGLDANKIESMTVFKDEAMIEQYGEKAKNGVIAIATKEENTFNSDVILKQEAVVESLNDSPIVAMASKGNNADVVYGTPLYVVDGAVLSSSLETVLSSRKVKSMNVLKGEAVAEIYGEAAKDGVIVITTEKK